MNYYLIIGILATSSSLIAAWMYFASIAHVLLKVSLGAFSLVMTISTWLMLPQVMAAPINGYPPAHSPIISSYLTQDHLTVYIWVMTKAGIRSYAIQNPNNKASGKKGNNSSDADFERLLKELKGGQSGGMTLERDGNGHPVVVPLSMPIKKG